MPHTSRQIKKFRTADETKNRANELFGVKETQTCKEPGCKHTSKRYSFTEGFCNGCYHDPAKRESRERLENERVAAEERRKALMNEEWGAFA